MVNKRIYVNTPSIFLFIYLLLVGGRGEGGGEEKLNTLGGLTAEAVARRCSIKKVFLKILPNSQENTCVEISILLVL